jgi:hypothetical protein
LSLLAFMAYAAATMSVENAPRRASMGWLRALLLALMSVSACMLCGLPTFRSMSQHDARLAHIERALEMLPLPPGTKRLGSYSRVGLLSGSGNHCDYLAIMVLGGPVERASLEEFYRHHTVPTPEEYPLEVRIGAGGLEPAPEYDDSLLAHDWKSALPFKGQQATVVYVFDAGHHPAADPRCH